MEVRNFAIFPEVVAKASAENHQLPSWVSLGLFSFQSISRHHRSTFSSYYRWIN